MYSIPYIVLYKSLYTYLNFFQKYMINKEGNLTFRENYMFIGGELWVYMEYKGIKW